MNDLVTDGSYTEEQCTQYNKLAALFWEMGEECRHEVAITFAVGNPDFPDFHEFWKLYTVMAIMRDVTQERVKTMGSVYFLRDDNSGNVKIGYTKGCAVTRTNQIKGMNHTPLTLLFHIKADDKCESRLHKLLRAHNIHHEWFDGNAVQPVIRFLEPIKHHGSALTADMLGDVCSTSTSLTPYKPLTR